jgi:hypothetical protein
MRELGYLSYIESEDELYIALPLSLQYSEF